MKKMSNTFHKALTIIILFFGELCWHWTTCTAWKGWPNFFKFNTFQSFPSNATDNRKYCQCLNRHFVTKRLMVSLGTHLVKTCESQSRTNEFQLKKQSVRNWKCLGLYVTRQFIWRQTQKRILHSTLKLKDSPSVSKHNVQRLKDIFFVKQQPQWLPQKLHEQAGHFDRNTCSDWLIDLCVIWDIACHGLFRIFRDFFVSGMQDTEEKKITA